MKLDLQYFTGYTVTVYKDGGFSAASASPNSSVSKDDDVTLAWTLSAGYELDEIEAVSGGPISINMSTKKFAMPNNDVVLNFKSKANNVYAVVEDCNVNINGTATHLAKNVQLLQSANGGVYGVTVSGTAITFDAAVVAQLVKDGVIVKI